MEEPSVPTAPVILLVEDEVLIRMAAADLLFDAGYRVVEAGTVREALAVIDVQDDVAVVFTDVRTPGDMDGFDLARVIAARAPALGVIVTSGHALPCDTTLPDGTVFLAKPYHGADLRHAVGGLLKPSSTLPPSQAAP